MRGNINNLMKQAQAMQANMQKVQEEIAALEVVGEAGGGRVTVTGASVALPDPSSVAEPASAPLMLNETVPVGLWPASATGCTAAVSVTASS